MKIEIWQINLHRDTNAVAFFGLDIAQKINKTGKINFSIYDKVFDGDVDCEDLEEVYYMFNMEQPDDYHGRSLSVSDIVKIIDLDGNEKLYYCDDIGFTKIGEGDLE